MVERRGRNDGSRSRTRRRHGSVRRVGLVAGVAALVAAGLALAVPSVPAGAQAAKGGPLSPRLQELVDAQPGADTASEQGAAVGLPATGEGSLLRRADRILVEVRGSDAGAVDQAASASRAQVVAADGAVATFAVDPGQLADLAASPGVISVVEVLTPALVNGVGATPGGETPEGGESPITNATCPSGVVSQGDAQLKAALARTNNSVDGTGVKVGVLSDSYNNVGGASADIASGDLPGPGNPCGHTTAVNVISELPSGGSDEGRAMLQIVHDLAPGAQLLFASAFQGEQDFANQIIALKNAGATVIIDDVSYFTEPFYQDGVVAAAINTVTAAGVSYYSSAGNSTRTIGGKSIGSYEAPSYRPVSCPSQLTSLSTGYLDCHDFNPTASTLNYEVLTVPAGQTLRMTVGWNQPQYGVATDFDVYLFDQASGVLRASAASDNATTGKASEYLSYSGGGTFLLVIARWSGTATPRIKWISHRTPFSFITFDTSSGGDVIGPTIFGHNAAKSAITTAAVPSDNSNTVESFSSEGPATYCWQPVSGTSPSASMPCTSKTIDLAATDGVSTTLSPSSGLNPFYGTSAAAPHAGAVDALQRQARPCRTRAEVQTALVASGRAVGSFGVNSVGSGLIDATTAISGLTSCGASTGLLRVTTSPAVPSQITVDGKIADTWGLKWVKVPVGSHTVCFGAVAGYTTPGCQVANITAGATTPITGNFTARGYLKVNTSPPVDSTISVDGIPRNNWGLWTDMPTGSHQVCFGPVAGRTPPSCQTVNVNAGATTEITGTFAASSASGPTGVGLLRVTTSPALPSQITVDGNIADTWGLNWLQVAPGSHQVCFRRVEGYTEPSCQTVNVSAGATTPVVGTFVQRGYLKVDTVPAVAGTISVDGSPADDWGVYTDLPTGSHQVCFGAVPGKTAPGCQTANVTAGLTTQINGNYT